MSINEIHGKAFDLQGHRGARGLLPENTIPAFIKALDIGVTTLEMDVAISSDGQVIVSHEPWMSAAICSHPGGAPVGKDEERTLRIYDMTAAEVAMYDCGKRGNPSFPEQQALSVSKPRLVDVIQAVNRHIQEKGYTAPRYNIEIKSTQEGDGVLHPSVDVYAKLLYDVLDAASLLQAADIQSFDARALEAVRAIDPDVGLVWLVSNDEGLDANLSKLSFTPDVYSPNLSLVDTALVSGVHALGMQLIPWTVNETAHMKALIDAGVDGFITDYPDRGKALIEELNR